MEIDHCLTSTTQILLKQINCSGINIILKVDTNLDTWEGQMLDENTFEITSNSHLANKQAFAHELLHAFLESKGFSLTYQESLQLIGHPVVITHGFLMSCYNNLAHHKMVSEFENMGFERKLFFQGSIEEQFSETNASINEIQLARLRNDFHYIGIFCNCIIHLILLRRFFYDDIDTNSLIQDLRNIDYQLFNICENVLSKWTESKTFKSASYFTMLQKELSAYHYQIDSKATWVL